MMQWQRVSSIFRLHIYYLQAGILRSVVFVGSCLFVCWSVSWLVHWLTSCQQLNWLAGAPFLVAHTSCINWVIANLLSKFKIFVSMATGVGLRQILLPQLNWSTPKTPFGARIANKPSYSQFSAQIAATGYRGNKCRSGVSLNDTIRSADP